MYPFPREDASPQYDEEFQFEKSGPELEHYISDVADTVRIALDQSIAILTPWFFNNLPQMYYKTTPRAEKVRHLTAVITGHVFESKQTVELWDNKLNKVTYIGPGTAPDLLLEMAQKVSGHEIRLGSIYFSRDRLLFLGTFFCSAFAAADLENPHIAQKVSDIRTRLTELYPDEPTLVATYLDHLDHDFVVYATQSRLEYTFKMLRHMLNHEGAHTFVEPFENAPTLRLTLGLKGLHPAQMMEHVFRLVHKYSFDVVRFFTIRFREGYSDTITVMHLILRHEPSRESVPRSREVALVKLNKALRTLGWSDSDAYNAFLSPPTELSINAVNLIRAAATWIHILLGKENIYYYSEYRIHQTFERQPLLTTGLVNLFRLKFSPLRASERENDGYAATRKALSDEVKQLLDRVERHIFDEAIRFVDHVLKTNYFFSSKSGLAFRVDPALLNPQHYPMQPFGIFYVIGRDARFFHIRWKDVSRGGLRVVMPRTDSDYSISLAGLFDEVYGLSHAQQLKNKDIPEGGSKAVLLLRPGGRREGAVKGSINAILDLLVGDDEIHQEQSSQQISYYEGGEEIIYFGPDENMTNDLITWVPMQAARRGYKYADAFMSSKPGAGINHKEFGVTSEGLHVYVDHMLRFLGIHPERETFRVKMTGGPDGDVAGNELRILHREYGEHARIVAIADGFGAAYDPAGLHWPELLRLVNQGLAIHHFELSKLSGHGDAFVIEATGADKIRQRNRLHFEAAADLFIPAGGRPYTVTADNWHLFQGPDGELTCRAVVEGANIFFTNEARDALQDAGMLMVKDSSANKTGVICSSFEIIASLLLSRQEFQEIKTTYVSEILHILRHKAAAEAQLLFREYQRSRGEKKLVDLSLDISREINEITDALLDDLTAQGAEVLRQPLFRDIVQRHCPPVLQQRYAERIATGLPPNHQMAIIAASIASFIVYNEGLGWLARLGRSHLTSAAITYMRVRIEADTLMQAVARSDIPERERIRLVLERAAARELTMLELLAAPADSE